MITIVKYHIYFGWYKFSKIEFLFEILKFKYF